MNFRLYVLLALAILILDQVTKYYIVNTVMVPPRVIEITGFFNLVLGWNDGISFGLFNWDSDTKDYVLSGIAVVVSGFLYYWAKSEDRLILWICCGAITGGALGNALDRMTWGAVADFLDVHAFGWHWPAFNVADIGISVGATILILDSLFGTQDSAKKEADV